MTFTMKAKRILFLLGVSVLFGFFLVVSTAIALTLACVTTLYILYERFRIKKTLKEKGSTQVIEAEYIVIDEKNK